MNGRIQLFAITAMIIASISMVPAFGQTTSPITVVTDEPSYEDGQRIVITGSVGIIYEGYPVTVLVKSPLGNLVSVDQIEVDSDGNYQTDMKTGGSLMASSGEYTIEVNYGSVSQSTTFEYEAAESHSHSDSDSILIDGAEDEIDYEITGGKITDIEPDVKSSSLIIYLDDTHDDGTVTLKIPRSVFDSVEDGDDEELLIFVDDDELLDYNEQTNKRFRTLTMSFPAGTEQIEIIGTFVVPEFGAIAAMILAVAIISIIAISAKSKLSIMPRY